MDYDLAKNIPYPPPDPNDVNFTIKLRLQGVTKKPASVKYMMARIGIVNDEMDEPLYLLMPFEVDEDGIWWAKTTYKAKYLPVTIGPDYKYIMLIKGQKHVQKKICSNPPGEAEAGAYNCEIANITFRYGMNHFDLYGITLLNGDLNQDGVVNAVDIAQVRNNINAKDSFILMLSDVNLDGAINMLDEASIMASLRIRTDQK
jgi:hypothetical protein